MGKVTSIYIITPHQALTMSSFLLLLSLLPNVVLADIDLTHTLGEGLDQGWKGNGNAQYRRTVLNNGSWADIVPYAYYAEFSTPEHSGTHTDSPSSFCLGQWHIHQIPLEHLSGPGVVIDISEKAKGIIIENKE